MENMVLNMRYMISLSDEVVKMLDEVAGKTGNTRSGVIHIAILEFLERYSQFFDLHFPLIK